MNNISMTGVGALVVTILVVVLPIFGVVADQGTITSGVESVVKALGFILLIAGQARRPDLKFGMIRKTVYERD